MKRNAVSHKPGDIVKLAGIDFVVLDNNMATCSDEPETLFILAVECQGESRFGDTNNYAESDLKEQVDGWCDGLIEALDEKFGCDRPRINSRVISLLTMDGRGEYGALEVMAAPLTLDEARKYAKFIPGCDNWSWLATGWGGPGMYGSRHAFFISTGGDWNGYYCSSTYGIRPALVISSELLDSENDESGLSSISTDELLEEVRRRIGE